MPNWRKAFYSILFFFMVAAAEMGNIIGEHKNWETSYVGKRDGEHRVSNSIIYGILRR
jgi:hypothetical protein